MDALRIILNAGVDTRFALNCAVSRSEIRPSYVRACLRACPQLRERRVLNGDTSISQRPLHLAARVADVDGVRAMIEAGAFVSQLDGRGITALTTAKQTYEALTASTQPAHVEMASTDQAGPDSAKSRQDATRAKRNRALQGNLDEIIHILRAAEGETLATAAIHSSSNSN